MSLISVLATNCFILYYTMRKKERIRPTLKIIESFWEKNPDLRFTQVLVWLNIIPNMPWMWFYKEDHDLFEWQEYIQDRDCTLWWSYWKDWKSNIQYRLLSKMSNAHLANIIEDHKEWMKISDDMVKKIKNELDYRKENNIFIAD